MTCVHNVSPLNCKNGWTVTHSPFVFPSVWDLSPDTPKIFVLVNDESSPWLIIWGVSSCTTTRCVSISPSHTPGPEHWIFPYPWWIYFSSETVQILQDHGSCYIKPTNNINLTLLAPQSPMHSSSSVGDIFSILVVVCRCKLTLLDTTFHTLQINSLYFFVRCSQCTPRLYDLVHSLPQPMLTALSHFLIPFNRMIYITLRFVRCLWRAWH